MKKILIAIMALATLAGCKKGENDPGISFRSRDARIVGEWKLTSYEYEDMNTIVTNTPPSTTVTSKKTTFSGGNYTSVSNPPSGSNDNAKYEYTLNIEKGGKATLTTVITSSNGATGTSVDEGTWVWLDNNKNKSVIFLEVSTPTFQADYFDGGQFDVDELRNKKLVLTSTSANSSTSTGAAGTSTDLTISTKAEFEQ